MVVPGAAVGEGLVAHLAVPGRLARRVGVFAAGWRIQIAEPTATPFFQVPTTAAALPIRDASAGELLASCKPKTMFSIRKTNIIKM